MEPAYRTEVVVAEDGSLHLDELPFRAGETVEVILIPRVVATHTYPVAPLRGSVLRHDRPAAPVAEEDWEALQ